MATTWRVQDGTLIRAEQGLHWAKYDATGARIATGSDRACVPTADELATWDTDAPAKAAELLAAFAAKVAAARQREQIERTSVKAQGGGFCAISGRRIRRGDRIRKTAAGWALADVAPMTTAELVAADPDALTRMMDREDSAL